MAPAIIPEDVVVDHVARNPYIPCSPHSRQLEFLELGCRNALFGGAASGGKSQALLMAALMFAQVPGYAALIVRRNFTDLKLPGGLIDRSVEWLGKNKGAHWNAQENRWRFREGSTLQFGYADKEGDEQRYHGTEFAFIGLDEAVQFTPRQIVFFQTERLRKKEDMPVPLRFRLATTPGGVGHDFLKKWFVNPGTPGDVFVPATIYDNPSTDQAGYVAGLEQLRRYDPLRYRQMLEGDWDAVEGGRFKRDWFGSYRTDPALRDTAILTAGPAHGGAEVERFRPEHCARFQTCDPAASTSKNADYFVLSTWLVTPRANVVWWGCKRDKLEIQEQVTTCQSLYRHHRPQFVAVEEVMNQRALAQLLRRSTNPVMVVKGVTPRGQNKADHAAGFISLAASGRVFLPEPGEHRDFPLEDVVNELVLFTGVPKKDANDDICLAGGTLVETATGPRPIETIRPGDRVWTRKGLRAVRAAGITSESAPVLTVKFSNGKELTGTPAHRVFVPGRGFVRLDRLSYDDKVVSWESHAPSRSNSTAGSTPGTRTRIAASTEFTSSVTTLGSKPRATCTATSGSSTTVRSRTGTKSTTTTATRSTTPSATCSASRATSTDASTPRGGLTAPPRSKPTSTVFVRWRPSGTGARRGGGGTPRTPSGAPRTESPRPARASSAAEPSSPSCRAPGCAATPARRPIVARPAWTTLTESARRAAGYSVSTSTKKREPAPVRVVTVSARGRCAVFNLTVEGEPEYFANGVLTHNCDSGAYMAELLPLVRPGHAGGTPRAPAKYEKVESPLGGLR